MPGVTPNGSIRLTEIDGIVINPGTPIAPPDYLIQWYTGTGTATPIVGATAPELNNLQGGAGQFFTVEIIYQPTGCRNTETLLVPSAPELPIITLAASDNTICTGTPDGTATLASLTYQGSAVSAPFTGYTFSWSNGATTPGINSLATGAYTLQVTKTDVGCQSDPVDVTVNDNTFIPPLSIALTNQTSCNSLTPNGSLSVAVDETGIGGSNNTTTGYTFAWIDNSNPFTSPGTPAGAGVTISNLPGNRYYSVTATRTGTGCTNTESVFLPELITNPIVAAAISSDVTRCDLPNGAMQANVSGLQVGYTFFWLNETGTNQTADKNFVINNANLTTVDNGNYTNLIPGYYTVVARDNATQCDSDPVTRIVLDNIQQSTITISPGPVLPSTCGASDGQLSATVSGGVGPFNLFWHNGGPINSDINFFNNPPQFTPPDDVPFATVNNANSSALTNLQSRLYTLIVRDNGNGCGNYQSIFLPFIDAHTISATVIPSADCLNPTGSVQVSVSNIIPSPPNTFQNYIYRLYSGENPDPAFAIGAPVGPGAAVTNPLVYSGLAPGKYTVEVQQDAASFGSSCSAYKVVEVVPAAYAPLLSVSNTAGNTSCDPLIADGQVSLEIRTDPRELSPSVNFTIDITPAPSGWGGPTVIGPFAPAALPTTFTITGLNSVNQIPQYTVFINSNNCITQRTLSIPNNSEPPLLANGSVVTTPSLVCSLPAGAVEITGIDRVGGNGSDPDFTNLGNYQFTWFTNAGLTPPTGIFQAQGNAPTPGQRLDAASFPGIGPGQFWVTAQKNAGSKGLGCTSAPFLATIRDLSRNPDVNLQSLPNTACDLTADGQLKVFVTNPGSLPSASFNYSWNVTNPVIIPPGTGNGNGDGSDSDNDNPINLIHGLYQLTVTNPATGCSTSVRTNISHNPLPVVITRTTSVNQLICTPDGAATVTEIQVGGTVDPSFANFDFTWFDGSLASPPAFSNQNSLNEINIFNYPAIDAGSYFVKVRRLSGLQPGSGCESAPVKIDILNQSIDPDITFSTVIPNSSCNPLIPNGFIEASASERNGNPPGNYTFSWLFNAGTLPGSVVETTNNPTSELSLAPEGGYTLSVTNLATGCSFSRDINLLLNQSLSLPNIVNILPTNPVDCLPTGSLRVTQITIGGTTSFTAPPDDIDTRFDYEWYKSATAPANILAGEQNSQLLNQLPDTYFVLVRDTQTDCASSFVEAVIDTASIIYPDVRIRQTTPQIICDVNMGGSGSLIATVDLARPLNSRNNFSNYDLFWFPNLNGSGSAINAASDTTVVSLRSGDYSVRVLDKTTQCESMAIFLIPEESGKYSPNLALTSSPLTLCNDIDSFVAAAAVPFEIGIPPNTYPFAYNYTADLYIGGNPNLNNPPDFIMQNDPANPTFTEFFLQPNTPPGVYTVRLTDNNTGCFTVESVTVGDERVFPVPSVVTITPVTNCNPNDPNGVGRASVNGILAGFQFDWFEGNTVTGTPFYTGAEYGQLKAEPVSYTIQATNLLTGCTGTTTTTFRLEPLPIPLPQIRIISHVTSCEIDNGALAASVNGNTSNYIFDWYNGTQEVPPPANTGEFYNNLPVGTYSVTATSLITGCKSPLVSENIIEQKIFPDFDFDITNPSCDQENGFVTLIFTSQVDLREIAWTDANGSVITFGPNLTEIPAGNYRVTATTILGCSATKDVTLLADIFPYNGISRNGDAKNSYFHIDCIQNFPNNLVKVFNRAGTLVYEAVGYDNDNILFDGLSNRGISPMGKNVPDGTYFYIIDKRDGSKPLAGYLEIVN